MSGPLGRLIVYLFVFTAITMTGAAKADAAKAKAFLFTGHDPYHTDMVTGVNRFEKALQKSTTNWDITKWINTSQISRQSVLNQLNSYPDQLTAGDTLFIFYIGHGYDIADQPPIDEDGPGNDGRDEVLVLGKGLDKSNLLVDDELFDLWKKFDAGVNIVFITNSCQNGTIHRFIVDGAADDEGEGATGLADIDAGLIHIGTSTDFEDTAVADDFSNHLAETLDSNGQCSMTYYQWFEKMKYLISASTPVFQELGVNTAAIKDTIAFTAVTGGGNNQPPAADFTFTVSGKTVSFKNASTDPDGSISAYTWTFGDKKTSTQADPSHTYTADGTYSVTLTVTDNEGATDAATKAVKIGATGKVCAIEGQDVSYEWIKQVDIGAFSNSSAGEGYADFTAKTINAEKGKAVNVKLTPGFKKDGYAEHFKIFVDLNQDGAFGDGEELFGKSGSAAVSGSITIPDDASDGNTILRVVMQYNAPPKACGVFKYGEAEDYTIAIGQGSSNENSCAGNCGKQAPGGCWCDSACERYGDCCSDKTEVCKD